MGLGKTAQICAFLGALADGPRRRPRAAEFSRGVETLRSALILAPTTMLSHWHRELNRWAPKAKVVVLHRSATNFDAAAAAGACHGSNTGSSGLRKLLGPARLALFLAQALSPPPRDEASEASCVICVASFDSLHRLAEALLPKKWGYVVLDEGQRIRNPHARITQLCKRVRTARRLLLSGTPVQNSLQELWSLFDFCCPGRLGTLEGFDREMATPIRVGGYTNARPSQVELAFRCAVALRDLIKPYLLRRTKQEVCVGDDSLCALPAKTEHVLLCRLTNDQYDLYRNIVDSAAVRDIQKGSTKAFTAIMALRKICNHPDLYAGAPEDSAPGEVDRSSKLAALETVLTRWKAQKHRVLIFSQSKQMLDIIEVLVRACGWGYSRIDGDTQPASRQATADEFNKAESDQFVMLLTTRVGGVGLSLIGADRVVLFDPDWNPQTDAQARERAWRLGQKKPVTIYRMICAGTIEEKMYHRQIFKQALTNRVLADPKQRRLFSQSELADLFKLGDAARPHGYDGPIIDDREVAPADTELLANGAGVVDRHGDDDGRGKDDKDVLRALWSGGGNMASVFSHDSVVTSTSVQREAERQAKSAVAHLQSTSRSAASRRAPSSRELLAGPAAPDGDDGGAGDRAASELSMKLVRRINAFLASKATAPTTKELIAHFADVGDQNAPLFRSILRQLAQCRDGRWVRLR